MTQVAGLWQLADELLAVQREQARAQAEKKGMELFKQWHADTVAVQC